MPDVPGTSGPSGFDDRLATAMEKARSKQSQTAASAPTSTPPHSDEFADRLRDAAGQARGEEPTADAGKVAGTEFHHFQPGETLEGIAAKYDLTPEEIWEHPNNEALVERRESPDALEEGDALYIPYQRQEDLEPIGEGDHVVREGECIASIAKDTGHFWKNIWNDPPNAELKKAREDPNVLLPGDRVTIPDIRPKQESGETEMRHRFVRRGEPSSLNVQVCVDDEPVGGEPYTVIIDGDDKNPIEGTTDNNGNISVPVPGNAKEAELRVGTGENQLVYELDLGNLPPKDDVGGAQRRLANMGFLASDSGELDSETREAIRDFQAEKGMSVTGELDKETEEKLREAHGS